MSTMVLRSLVSVAMRAAVRTVARRHIVGGWTVDMSTDGLIGIVSVPSAWASCASANTGSSISQIVR
jgi:hypothetical protein